MDLISSEKYEALILGCGFDFNLCAILSLYVLFYVYVGYDFAKFFNVFSNIGYG